MPYDSALICINGHVINSYFYKYPDENSSYCPECGALTIKQCPNCNKEIRGHSIGELSYLSDYKLPSYCIYCGKPFPWTKAAIESTALIIAEEKSLDEQEQVALIEILPDIVSETPKTNLAIVRLKKCFSSVGKFTVDALRQFAIDFGCELAKSSLGL